MSFAESAWLLVIGGAISAATAIATQVITAVRDGRKQTRELASTEALAVESGKQRALDEDRARNSRLSDERTGASRDSAKLCLEELLRLNEDFDQQRESARQGGSIRGFEFTVPDLREMKIKAAAYLIDDAETTQAVLDGLVVIDAIRVMIDMGYIGDGSPSTSVTWHQRRTLESVIRLVAAYLRGAPDRSAANQLAAQRKDANQAYGERYGE